MNLQSLLGDTPKQQFVAENYQRLPFSRRDEANSLASLASWETLVDVVTRSDADLLIVRQGHPYQGDPPRTVETAKQLTDDGYTFRVRHAEKLHPGLAEVAAAFARDFAAHVDIHMYCTPAEQFGFSWHYDAEEVFIVQTTGRKEYSLRKNTVNPWPIEETLPADMRYEREIMPLMKCELRAGDWIYIPSGYWHMGAAKETSISLSIGVMPITGVDLFDHLRPKVLDSLLWRQRLPTPGEASNLSDEQLGIAYRELAGELGKDLTKMLGSDYMVGHFLSYIRARSVEKYDGDDQQGTQSK